MSVRSVVSLDRTSLGVALLLTGACKATEPPVPDMLSLVQGSAQMAQAGTELPTPVVVRLLDVDGAPIGGFPVGFVVTQGGGTVNPASAKTDEAGEVAVRWTLGPNDAAQLLQATAGTLTPVVVAAVGILPTDLVVAQGLGQSARAGSALANSIVVRVVGQDNVPMKGIPVAFQVVSGGGQITPQSGVTNANGEVQTRWTLGPALGVQTVQAVTGSVQPITITAIATP
jgi:adhesin/invasin